MNAIDIAVIVACFVGIRTPPNGWCSREGIRRPGLHDKTGRIHWCGRGHNIFWRNIRIKGLP